MEKTKKDMLIQFYREKIVQAAKDLFEIRGISATTVDDIAKAAGISKSTMYVYYKKKEEIIQDIQLEQMLVLHDMIAGCGKKEQGIVSFYHSVCKEMVKVQEQLPVCSSLLFEEILISDEALSGSEALQKIYEAGEAIDEMIAAMLTEGIKDSIVKTQIEIIPTVSYLWSGISTIISFAAKKQKYIKKQTGMGKKEYRDYAFKLLLNSILVEDLI
jgi:AcrR family transcriptional regulator